MNSLDIAKQYNRFQNDIGQFSDTNLDHVISSLFSKSFQKVANGVKLVATRNALRDQLLAVRDQAGKWTIDVIEVAALQDPNRALIRYHLVSTNLGVFDIMATLRISSEGLIEEVDE